MFDFPTNPATGTVVTTPDASYRVWDGGKWRASPSANISPGVLFLPITGGTLGGDLIMTTGTRIGMDTAATGGVPYMAMASDGSSVNFMADTWAFGVVGGGTSRTNLKVIGNGAADEYWGITGGVNGEGCTLKAYSVSGGWPCIGNIAASNEGQLFFGNDNGTILNLRGPTGNLAKNYVRITSGGPSVDPTIAAIGEANSDLSLIAMGTGNVYMSNANGVSAQIGSATASLVNYVQVSGSAAGSPPSVAAAGTDTDIDLLLLYKGNGSIRASTQGNVRGTRSVDFQNVRSAATQVASGANSVVAGGNSNTASAQFSSVLGGFENTNDGYGASILGGQRAWARGQTGWLGYANGVVQGVTDGDAQIGWRTLMGVSTGGAAVRLTADRGAINTTAPNINSVYIGSSLTVGMTIIIVGCDKTASASRMNYYFNDVLIAKTGTGGNSIYLGTPRTLGVDLPTVAVTVGAEGLLSVVVTPINTNTWHFLAKLSTAEVN